MSYTKEIEFKIPFEYDDINDQQRRALEKAQSLADDTVESFTEPWEREIVWERHQDGGFHKIVRFTSEFTYVGKPPVPPVKVNPGLLTPLPDDNSYFGQWRAGRKGRS